MKRLLPRVAIVLSVIIGAGFVLFAAQDIDRASNTSRNRIAGDPTATDPTPAGEREREQQNGRMHEIVDDANDVLLRPFAPVSDSAGSVWMRRGVPALLGLLSYGFVLGFAARYGVARA
jgi:hypothetical protein